MLPSSTVRRGFHETKRDVFEEMLPAALIRSGYTFGPSYLSSSYAIICIPVEKVSVYGARSGRCLPIARCWLSIRLHPLSHRMGCHRRLSFQSERQGGIFARTRRELLGVELNTRCLTHHAGHGEHAEHAHQLNLGHPHRDSQQ